MARMIRVASVWLSCALVVGCGGPAAGPDAGGEPRDAASRDGEGPDGGGGGACMRDEDCDDGTFCDGEERCMPGATDADERGCVEALSSPCAEGEECDERARTCDAICVDADGDGHGSVDCGGDDCDDGDANRFPGNVEVCDSRAHDEDCNPETYGFLDADGDGSGAAVCCNVGEGGDLLCGDDCNDGDSSVNPRAGDGPPLFCDGVDNDCSGTADEGCPCVEGETQECGTEAQRLRIGACRPGTQVCSGGAFTETCIGAVSPSEELCDGLDNDCDAMVDEGVLRTYHADVDGDGFGSPTGMPAEACSAPSGYASNATDCDDAVPSVNPGASEVCNGLDDNCFGGVDEGFIGTFYLDADGDGFGDATVSMMICSPPAGYVRNATDCDDGNASRNPATIEGCNGVDDNCNGSTDEGLLRTFYADVDGDGWGVATSSTSACTVPSGYAERFGDCDDARASTNPAGAEVCNGRDDNCADGTDEGVLRTFYRDADRDGFGADAMTTTACTAPSGYTDRGGDCQDGSAGVNPSSAERCNGVDDDCDGTVDSGCSCTDGASRSCGPSTDVGECNFGTQTCVAGSWGGCVGAVLEAAESCNGRDDDCDGTIDDGVVASGCYRDGDGDGYGTGGATTQCGDASRAAFGSCPVGWTNVATDCNDGVSAVRPGASEVCDGVDQNCNGTVDEGSTIACYADADGDGYGSGGSVARCADASRTTVGGCPSGYSNVATDCNDGSSTARPMGTELCNGIDDNCDGSVDEGRRVTCYVDADGDGYGTGASSSQCRDAARTAFGECPVGYASVATDCNDASSAARPGGSEVCNGVDDDCDGSTDELLRVTCYVDADGDAYGAGASSSQCRDAARTAYGECPVGYANVATDCSDTNAGARPGATEVCNGVDDNCTGGVDEGVTATCFVDADGDGYGAGSSSSRCRDSARSSFGFCPVGYSNVATDCSDTNASSRPGATEVCNGVDDNCTGGVDEGVTATCFVDADGDGYGTGSSSSRCSDPTRTTRGFCPVGYSNVAGDCADTDGTSQPGAAERCNGADDDCDGSVDEGVRNAYYPDADGDGFGSSTAAASSACAAPAGYVATNTDCNDTSASVHPGVADVCNGGVDDDCSGSADPGCVCTDGTTRACGPGTTTGACDQGTQRCVGGVWAECVGAIYPITEVCNSSDDNCDGTADEGTTASCRRDGDGDGYGTGSALTVCAAAGGGCPSGYVSSAVATLDCNDAVTSIRPGATELCNAVDDDCDGTADEGATVSCRVDGDGDGFGVGSAVSVCPASGGGCPAGYVASTVSTLDCNDAVSTIRPGTAGAAETACNGIDDDCDGTIDEGSTVSCRRDGDGDGYGAGDVLSVCPAAGGLCPTGYVATTVALDCNDAVSSIRPGAVGAAETACNGIDDDCDGTIDDSATVSCRRDGDGDGYGAGTSVAVCPASGGGCPSGYTSPTGAVDCNDAVSSISPGAIESCNGLDDDCDSSTDESLRLACYEDRDADTYGYGAASSLCPGTSYGGCPTGYSSRASDCNDGDSFISPAATERCNGVSDDCDATIDTDGVGFTCVQGVTEYCTTACGTSGTRVCRGDTCTWVNATCSATETCNYCDDDADGTFYDDSSLAPATLTTAGERCGQFLPVPALGVSCETSRSLRMNDGTTLALPLSTQLIQGAEVNDLGASWWGSTLTLGYEPVTFRVAVAASGGSTATRGSGWALVVANDTGSNLGNAGGELGVPYTRRGISVEWRFRNGASDLDLLTARRLTGAGTGVSLGTSSVTDPARRLDNAATGYVLQYLLVRFTPPNPLSGRVGRLEVFQELDLTTFTPVSISSTDVPADWVPGTVLRFGVTASSSATETANVIWVQALSNLVVQTGLCL